MIIYQSSANLYLHVGTNQEYQEQAESEWYAAIGSKQRMTLLAYSIALSRMLWADSRVTHAMIGTSQKTFEASEAANHTSPITSAILPRIAGGSRASGGARPSDASATFI